MKLVTSYKNKTLRNLKVSEIVHICKSYELCDSCPLVDYCIFFESHIPLLEQYFNRRIRIKYTYKRK